LITLLHAAINLHAFHPKSVSREQKKFRIGFLPVTCHLTCPVTDFINKQLTGDNIFEPVRFNGWPELKEAYLSGYTPATFILAPMAMALREQGVPIKIVYLGHRDGSAVMVHKDSHIYRMEDLRGKRIAVPNRFSNQRLLIFRALKQAGMTINDVELVEMPPPDMPCPVADQGCLAKFHLVCSGRSRRDDQNQARYRPTIGRWHCQERQVDRQEHGSSNGNRAVCEQVLLQSKPAAAHIRSE
jgi:ABC-type nitrate/sulfonate/bicarbonate transport system substrate-binding protein